jgi:osmotically-inducible protein OsmY
MKKPEDSISDKYLREAILTVFATDSRTASSDLRVGVLNGIAHLAGAVDSMAKRDTAEELANQVCGIRGVVNRIDAPGAPSPSRTVNLDIKNKKGRSIET